MSSKPFNLTLLATVADAAVLLPLGDDLRPCFLSSLAIARTDGAGGFTVDVYSRLLTSGTVNIGRLEQSAEGKCLVTVDGWIPVRKYDPVTIAGAAIGGYNATHRVLRVVSDQQFVLNTDFSGALSASGTAKLDIPANEQPAWKLLPQLSYTTADQKSLLNTPFECQDGARNGKVTGRLYLKFDDTGEYVINLRGYHWLG